MRNVVHAGLVVCMLALIVVATPVRSASAACDTAPACVPIIRTQWRITTQTIEQFLDQQFSNHRDFLVNTFWQDNILPAMEMMADQLSAVSVQQTQIIGSFIDAKHQMETQRVLQTIRARAHKDYHPSAGLCEFGTSVKSLSASERKAELNAHVMSQRSQDRQLGNQNTSAAKGPEEDLANRFQQFITTYCDPNDAGGNLDLLCRHPGGVGANNPRRANNDIDYVRTIEYPWTLNLDFTDQNITENEEDVLALANNLYGDQVFDRIENALTLQHPTNTSGAPNSVNSQGMTEAQVDALRGVYMDARSLLAKRSVAENSYNAITSMKSAGTQGSRDFLEAILLELGVKDNDGTPDSLLRTLGFDDANNEIGPSYYAQMEVLTKKIYQNPDFYTNLYDKPANVERKRVAMQAIGLMQKFDLFKSYLRNEANLSILLELDVADLQTKAENALSSQKSGE